LTISIASAPAEDEEVDWSSDSDDESAAPAKPSTAPTDATPKPTSTPDLAKSQTTIKPDAESETLKPAQPRRSHDEKSVADSDASYDLVSGATSRAPSRAPGSPRTKAEEVDKKQAVAEESEDDDWE
jgi:hypothetical protein